VWDDIPSVAEMLDKVAEAFIRLLIHGLEDLRFGWSLVRPLEISNE
jgi:hypothetical protein